MNIFVLMTVEVLCEKFVLLLEFQRIIEVSGLLYELLSVFNIPSTNQL